LINTAAAFAANNFQQGQTAIWELQIRLEVFLQSAAMQIGNDFFAAPGTALNGTIRRLVFFPQRLANTTLQTITQI
jgi:hypothetical protein